MLVETVQVPAKLSSEDLRPGTDEALRKTCETVFHGDKTSEDVLRDQEKFQEIAEVFRDDLTDLQGEKIATLRHQREVLLSELMKDPADSFHGEFLQLMLLFEDRAIVEELYNGQVVGQFCTQNHEKGICDYLFECRSMPSGKETFEATKVFTIFGTPDMIHLTLDDTGLHVQGEKRGHSGITTRFDLDEDKRKQVLEQFFFDTIKASASQFERNPEAQRENNRRAKGYLSKLRANEYAGR